MGWKEAAIILESAISTNIKNKTVTGDLAYQNPGAIQVGTKEYAEMIIQNMK